jgi:hypothetical protein
MKYLTLSCILLTTSCVALKERDDRQTAKYVKRHIEKYYHRSDSLVAAAQNSNLSLDKNRVQVVFKSASFYRDEPNDSVVIYKDMTLLGITEVIYDFSVLPLEYPQDSSYKGDQKAFIQIAPRLYLKRRPVPLM